MEIRKKKYLISVIVLLITHTHSFSQNTNASPFLINSDKPVICEGTDFDGSQMLRVFGKGKNLKEAVRDASKKAVYATIFLGVRNGKRGCDLKPIVNAPNAREKHSEFFDKFLSDNGRYKKFVTNNTKTRSMTKLNTGGNGRMYGMIVTVNNSLLRSELVNENILKQ